QHTQLGGEIGTAALELAAARLVAGRRAPRGRGDIAVVERQAVVARPRLRLAREAMAIQRLVQPGAARVSREHAAGAVRAVRRWRKPDNEQTRFGIAEARDRFAPIRPVRELTLLVARDAPAIGAQPRAACTRLNGAVDAGDGGQLIGGHSPNVFRRCSRDLALPMKW